MILNGLSLFNAHPIRGMLNEKRREHGVSYGLAEAGYDIRIKQGISFVPLLDRRGQILRIDGEQEEVIDGRFTIASAIEEFDMPHNVVGIVHDKSTWARQGLSVFNTVIEPGWKGFLTLELVFHSQKPVIIPAGAGIAQVIFHLTSDKGEYSGKYQNQEDQPVDSRWDGSHG